MRQLTCEKRGLCPQQPQSPSLWALATSPHFSAFGLPKWEIPLAASAGLTFLPPGQGPLAVVAEIRCFESQQERKPWLQAYISTVFSS